MSVRKTNAGSVRSIPKERILCRGMTKWVGLEDMGVQCKQVVVLINRHSYKNLSTSGYVMRSF